MAKFGQEATLEHTLQAQITLRAKIYFDQAAAKDPQFKYLAIQKSILRLFMGCSGYWYVNTVLKGITMFFFGVMNSSRH